MTLNQANIMRRKWFAVCGALLMAACSSREQARPPVAQPAVATPEETPRVAYSYGITVHGRPGSDIFFAVSPSREPDYDKLNWFHVRFVPESGVFTFAFNMDKSERFIALHAKWPKNRVRKVVEPSKHKSIEVDMTKE